MSDNITNSLDYIGKKVMVKMDRQLGTKHPKFDWEYKLNYGFIPDTMSPDGEELDAYVIGVDEPVETFDGVCVAVIRREDDNDDKLIVVPEDHPEISDQDILDATHFQEQFFKPQVLRGSES